MHKQFIICIIAILILFFLLGFDSRLEVTNYTYKSSEIPSDFDGFKICQISDLHCKNFGKDNQTLISAIQEMNPDLVVLTGDIVDDAHTDLSSVENLFMNLQVLQIPTYFVTGNHELEESAATQYAQLLNLMETYQITHLDEHTQSITIDSSSILITGAKWCSNNITHSLKPANPDGFHILLYHGADAFDLISEYNYDLILSGHIHGGVIRIPYLGIGVLGNTGKLFPKYTHGMYQNESKNCTMIVSRGLGDAIIPRFYNRPELVCITLRSE